MILATIMAVTPLQAAASSEVTEDVDTASYQVENAAFEQADFPVQPEEHSPAQDSYNANSYNADSYNTD